MGDVESHLDLQIGYLPDGCEPVGLDGDGRGTIVGAAFTCPEAIGLRIEHLAEEVAGDAPATPSLVAPGRVEWRDEPSGDVIRVVSEQSEIESLLRVARSIEIRR